MHFQKIKSHFFLEPQYGHSQSEKKLGLGEKYHRSNKVHTLEAQNQHQLKSPFQTQLYL